MLKSCAAAMFHSAQYAGVAICCSTPAGVGRHRHNLEIQAYSEELQEVAVL